MRPANIFKYQNRLAKAVGSRTGMTAQEAIPAAQARVELVREPTLAEIDAALGEIYGLSEPLKAEHDRAGLRRMYDAANLIVATAGVFGLEELGQAAWSLCELASRFEATGRFSWAMIAVHIDGLRLLRYPTDHPRAHREAVLAGLRQVTASIV
ncbi:hypothetical protein DJ021_06365 [Phenylobacterium hankyongense]|uniref:Chemotaxis protein CheE n=1 Tax=Phenylobacterium hankyongense TaxID=1813876 RepID=A0A328B0R6_9CAUL|nr:hypothetical protein [Phenylobacterium hankyongense]RAK59454.1 hypothetical protein DJ021_06365 [Phenylobacterium hankyongense]